MSFAIIKFAVAGGLIYWLIESGKLDVTQLKVFFTEPKVLVGALFHFLVIGVFLGALRLRLLLRGLGIKIDMARMSRFTLIGLFFNASMPGAVGGDLVKALYVIKDQKSGGKTPVMMAILIDRISGMTGLFLIGLCTIALQFQTLWANQTIQPFILMVVGLLVFMLFLHILAIRKVADDNDPIFKLLNYNFPGASVFLKIYRAFRMFKDQPKILFQALAVSIAIQFLSFVYFAIITNSLIADFDNWAGLATVFPLGILTAALPISPGGLGVGHLAFERLIDMIGFKGGSNVYNVFVLGYLALSMTGSIAYMTNKKKVQMSELNDLETADTTQGA